MSYDPDRHHRRSIRLRDYDYSQAGAYFITICTQGRECPFGEIVDGTMILNGAGRMVEKCWHDIPAHFPDIELDEFVVMPNHVHGILSIIKPVGANIGENVRTDVRVNVGAKNGVVDVGAKNVSPLPSQQRPGTSKTIGSIIRGLKIGVTKWMREHTPIHNIWQRNYFEHIIRDEAALNRIRQYIMENPVRWAEDTENPARQSHRGQKS